MSEYLGFKEIRVDDNDANLVFSGDFNQTYDCIQNEYFIVEDKNGDVLDIFRCDHGRAVKVPFEKITSKTNGDIKPRNPQQRMAINMLMNANMTVKVLTGQFGAGKDLLMSAAAVKLVEEGKFDKIVFVRNNIEVENTKPIGFLPGTYEEKMLPYAMPLADHIGGKDSLLNMMDDGTVEVAHLGLIRGRDIKNSIIICTEAENLTTSHVKLLIGRVGEGSQIWFNGDSAQCDAEVFRRDNGLERMIERLSGHDLFGYVKLMKSERSATAALASLLD